MQFVVLQHARSGKFSAQYFHVSTFWVDVLTAMFDHESWRLATKHLVKVPNFIDESGVMNYPSLLKRKDAAMSEWEVMRYPRKPI